MFVEVFNDLLEDVGLNKKQFSEKCGIPYTTVIGWTKQNRLPDFASLIKIADFFHCSIDYLAERQIGSEEMHYLSVNEKMLLERFEKLSADNKQLINKLIEKLSE